MGEDHCHLLVPELSGKEYLRQYLRLQANTIDVLFFPLGMSVTRTLPDCHTSVGTPSQCSHADGIPNSQYTIGTTGRRLQSLQHTLIQQ